MLVRELAGRLGVGELLDRVTVKKRSRGYSPAQAILGLCEMLIAGGECLDDVALLRADSAQELLRGHGLPDHPPLFPDGARQSPHAVRWRGDSRFCSGVSVSRSAVRRYRQRAEAKPVSPARVVFCGNHDTRRRGPTRCSAHQERTAGSIDKHVLHADAQGFVVVSASRLSAQVRQPAPADLLLPGRIARPRSG